MEQRTTIPSTITPPWPDVSILRVNHFLATQNEVDSIFCKKSSSLLTEPISGNFSLPLWDLLPVLLLRFPLRYRHHLLLNNTESTNWHMNYSLPSYSN